MPLSLAMLVVLSICGKMRTQFLWNLNMFFVYMWLSREIPLHDIKFASTKYGPFCNRIKKVIKYLEEHDYVSSHYTPYMYQDDLDILINDTFFEESLVYVLTDEGEKYAKKIAKLYHIDLTNPKIRNTLNIDFYDDTAFLLEAVRINYPSMIIGKKEKA
jgi:hypothetical protein